MDKHKSSYDWKKYQRDVEPIINRIYLIYGSFSLITALVQYSIHYSDNIALFINTLFCCVLLLIFFLRNVIPVWFRAIFICLLAGISIITSHISNGLIGTGFLTSLALILTLMIFFRTRIAVIVSILLLGITAGILILVATGRWYYDQQVFEKVNSLGLWLPFFFNLMAISIICITTLDYFRKKMFGQIKNLEGINCELKNKEQILENYAHYDLLTGLPNWNYFFETLSERVAGKEWQKGALLIINIKQFRITNLRLGTEQADEILKLIGFVLSHVAQEERDLVCRLIGDEFLIWTGIADPEGIITLQKHILSEVQKTVTEAISQDILLNFAAAIYRENEDIPAVYSRAVLAMNRAKIKDDGELFFYQEEMMTGFMKERQLHTALIEAIDKEEFEMFYQEQWDMESNKVVGLESLARWKNHGGTYISPGIFVPIIKKYNLILPFGYLTADLVFRDTARLQAVYGPELTISLNISPVLFLSSGFIEFIRIKKETYLIGDNVITLELTEDIFVEDSSLLVKIFSELKKAGFLISLDDFGTGFSSLSYLSHIDFDEVKIDMSLVKNIEEDRKQLGVIEAICLLSSILKFKIVAEGVERNSQQDLLQKAGCHCIQGYLHSKPKPLKELV